MPAKEPQGSFRYRQPPSHQEGHWRRDRSGLSPHRSEGHGAVCRRHHGFGVPSRVPGGYFLRRSEEHTSELQSLMRISYAVFCLKKKKKQTNKNNTRQHTQDSKYTE